MSTTTLNVIGLCMDIAGVILIWKFGLPPNVHPEGEEPYVGGVPTQREKQKAAKCKLRSTIGLILIVLGFACQIAANLLPASVAVWIPDVPLVRTPSSTP